MAKTRGRGRGGRGELGHHYLYEVREKLLEDDAKAAESGLFCVKCEVGGIEVNVIGIWIIKKFAGGRREEYGRLEREISIENRFFATAKSRFFRSTYYGYF